MRPRATENDAPATMAHLDAASCIGQRHSSGFRPSSNAALESVMHFPYPGHRARFRDLETSSPGRMPLPLLELTRHFFMIIPRVNHRNEQCREILIRWKNERLRRLSTSCSTPNNPTTRLCSRQHDFFHIVLFDNV